MKPQILLCLIALFLFSCKGEDSKPIAQATTNANNAHPAQATKKGNTPIKIDARGGAMIDQIKQQEIADERQKRLQHLDTGGLKWTTFDKIARSGENKGNKKYLVDVYTEWCGWCKVMDKKTFTDPKVQEYLRENFHIVKFDAEQKETVKFKEKDYKYIPGGRKGINQLALELLGNRMSYPTLVYLDENLNKITASPGYKKPDQLMKELKAIASK